MNIDEVHGILNAYEIRIKKSKSNKKEVVLKVSKKTNEQNQRLFWQ